MQGLGIWRQDDFSFYELVAEAGWRFERQVLLNLNAAGD
jgi:hypothetical protein